ncbi:MAG TPA: Asp-tRNA(Asn)/Glu-tRNA(Gln) amidotransferase subunit GatC [Vicinamibacterales bacterium]|jgi:aspartyl-tRNA(Asn)/glutamyl-tRNA(Gln) amidotransferase subunit C
MLAFGVPAEFPPDRILEIAALARVELDPIEVDTFARQLSQILDYANQVQQVDTTDVPPTTVVGVHSAERDDEPRPSLDRRDVFANAPDAVHEAGLFRVPRVIG